jgi:hypothetical protein
VGAPRITVEGGGYVPRWCGGRDTVCCAKPVASRRGHVTCSVFVWAAPWGLGMGAGAEWGALGHVTGVGWSVASAWVRVVDVGGYIDGDGGWLV